MAKRTDSRLAVLIQVLDELGFDRETIQKVSGVPQRTVSDIANRRGYWSPTGEFNEVRETYRLYFRKCIRDDALALGYAVLERFEELTRTADLMTTLKIANVLTTLADKFDDGR